MDFRAYLSHVAGNWKLVLAATAPAALSRAFDMAPPWPDPSGNASYALTAVLSIIGLLVPYTLRRMRHRAAYMIAAGALAAASAVLFMGAWSQWVGEASAKQGEELVRIRYVRGAELVAPPPGTTLDQMIILHGFRMEQIYSSSALRRSRLILLFSFSSIFFFLTVAVTTTALQNR